jgi:hypothetical protein
MVVSLIVIVVGGLCCGLLVAMDDDAVEIGILGSRFTSALLCEQICEGPLLWIHIDWSISFEI